MHKHRLYSAIISSPLGKIGIVTTQGKLSALEILPESSEIIHPSEALDKSIVTQLANYFINPVFKFNLDFHLTGTSFQKNVWRALQEIPSGETLTYGELAKQLDTSPRAIGQACRTNPVPVIIPCHRIVAANHLGGYAGATEGKLMEIKTWLLQHEARTAAHPLLSSAN